MIELVQFPWSPFCLVQRRILEFARVRFKLVNIPNGDRTLVWRLTRQRYYQVPILKDGRTVIFETADDSQVIAKYLDSQFDLGLFPREWEGVQFILWRHIESEVEGAGFKLNDIFYERMVPVSDRLRFIRHKERKFGRGCLEQWKAQRKQLLAQLTQALLPYEEMLMHHPFLLGAEPRFVDFDLFGVLQNFLYSGEYRLPGLFGQLKGWYQRMAVLKCVPSDREKLHS